MRARFFINTINILLLLLCAWALAKLTWGVAGSFLPGITPAEPEAGTTITSSPAPESPPASLKALTQTNLFGKTPDTQNKQPESRKRLVVSKLKIRLMGVISGDESARAAIIFHNGTQRAYLIGETIPAGDEQVILDDVLSDHIVIERNSVQEIIRLGQRKTTAAPGIRVSHQAVMQAIEADLSSDTYRSLIGDARETLTKKPLSLSKFFFIQPVQEQGTLTGYRLQPGADPRLFKALQLQANDLLTDVNGQPVSTLSLTNFSQLLAQNTELQLTLLRNAESVSFTVSF
ncbi:MAG: type II secretion system protein GspC [Pontibacterium sp.]